MQVDFEREREFWNDHAPEEERYLNFRSINRTLRWREIERHLGGVNTILDIGGGTGAFTIPLAERGFSVTHLDLSPGMIEIAQRKAQALKNITFVEGNTVDLSRFPSGSFDLVLNMDGPISSCGPKAERAIIESARVARHKLIISVAHRAWMIPLWLTSGLRAGGSFLPAVYAMLNKGEWHPDQFPENAMLAERLPFRYFKAFLPGELKEILQRAGMKVLRAGGVGSLSGLCEEEAVEQLLKDETLFQEFLTLCERFDEISPEGPGTRNDTGLLAVAERPVT